MRIDKAARVTGACWVAVAALVATTLEHSELLPLMIVALALACTLTAVELLRPHLSAADECVRLGIEIGERRGRRAHLPTVVPIRRPVCECGGGRERASVGH